jgi:hypothetical protein
MNILDQKWRLNNLYKIVDENHNAINFCMDKREVQKHLYENLHSRNIIVKSRKHGVTTKWNILALDTSLFTLNVQAHIIAHTLPDAKRFLENMIKFAYENIKIPKIKNKIKITADTKTELSFSNNSQICVSTSARSGTPNMLFISEFGKICAEYSKKEREIITGALNAVPTHNSLVIIESTAEGAHGAFYDIATNAFKRQEAGEPLTKLDYKPFFFGWYQKPECWVIPTNITIPKELNNYFKELREKHKIKLNLGQMAWYAKTYEIQQDRMKQEFPSTWREAFETSIHGAYYTKQMSKLRSEKRHIDVLYNPELLVHTAWDLGKREKMAIVFFQISGDKIKVIDCYEKSDEDITHFIKLLKSKPYNYGTHFAPNDINVRELWSKHSRKTIAKKEYNLKFKDLEQCKSLVEDINQVRRTFFSIYIKQETCKELIKSLDNYRQKFDEKNGVFLSTPVENKFCHFADAFRYMIKGLEYLKVKPINTNIPYTSVENRGNAWMSV